ncbi:MAG: isopeptide-forming domain-containing fimbrial protein, partial [Oscillospiraceae bacterium]|nr:isopeptide-forming domain-containing fimbrial protein [Oscillospiraceae bacterium]
AICEWLRNTLGGYKEDENGNIVADPGTVTLTPVASVTADDPIEKFDNLAYGYYYVTSSLGTAVTIDSAMKDVTVVDKNQGPSWDNEIPDPDNPNPGKVIIEDGVKKTVNTADYGDTVNFSIAVNATAYNGTKLVTYYHITDTLSEGFGPAQGIKVYVGGNELASTAYTLSQNGNKFDITSPFGLKYGKSTKIEVTYSADVLDTAAVVLAGAGNPNTANFTWTEDDYDPNDPNPPFDPEDPTDPDYPPADPPSYTETNERKTHTYVYALGILKVDPQGNTLPGAEFSVKDPDGNTVYAKGSAGDYSYCKSTDDGAVTQFATNADGLLVIKGVAAGSYEVKEEVAPKGYNLLLTPKTVEAEMTRAYTTTITYYLDANGNVTDSTENTTETVYSDVPVNVAGMVVVNNAGTELPSTGGIGTTIFYMLGGILLVGAGVLLFVRKRVGYEK